MQNFSEWLEKTVNGLGFELVDLLWPQGKGMLQLFIDKPDGVTIDDCVFVSNHLTKLFMVENIEYDRLEVSSPGLDRVLRKPEDFVRFSGREIKLKLRAPIEELGKQKQLTGLLKSFEQGNLQLALADGKEVTISLDQLEKARLVPQL